MSFRLFIYYSAMCGGLTAFVSWIFGRLAGTQDAVGSAGIKGMWLGMLVALGLGIVDALWNFGRSQFGRVFPRILSCVAIGTIGGLVGGVVGQLISDLAERTGLSVLGMLGWVLGWTLTGLLVGVSVGLFDVLTRFIKQEEVRPARRKLINGIIGGTLGGVLGGVLSFYLGGFWQNLLHTQDPWSPSAMGFVALGICIGLMIGLTQVILRESWIKVEKGFRAGREMLLARPELTIGRAESCDLGLFGDPTVEKLHARILRQGDRYLVADNDTPAGTYVNEERISQPMPLRSGDRIRVGKHVLLFGERSKR
jgi:MFS family permease